MARKLIGKCRLCGKILVFEEFDGSNYCSKCAASMAEAAERNRQREAEERRREDEKAAAISRITACPIILSDEKRSRQSGFELPNLSNITPKGDYRSYIAIDVETTGLNGGTDRIVELSAVKFQDGHAIETFSTLINPGKPIPAEAVAIHHITDEMIKDAPTISQVLPSFESFLDCPIITAHNLEFDLKFLYYSGCRILEQKHKYIDTLAQSRKKIKKDEIFGYALSDVCGYYRIQQAGSHRALADAMACGEVFRNLVEEVQS